MMDSPRIEFRLAYVGMSRHTDSVDIYLDETELHQRMDKMLGKSEPISAKLKQHKRHQQKDRADAEVIPVQLGRYSRAEMLQTVA